MKSALIATFAPLPGEREHNVRLGSTDQIRTATRTMANILSARGLCVWISVDGVTFPIGDINYLDKAPAGFTFESRATLERLFRGMRLFDFAMAYIDGRMKIDGPIEKAVEILDAVNVATDRPQTFTEYWQSLLFRTGKAFFPKFAARFESLDHYSQSARAYELFLDDHMQYTCGRFEKGSEDINEAQRKKFHLIEGLVTKHAGTLAGKDHLDIGCGWGGMVGYFKNCFETRSVGNTNCEQQVGYAQKRYGCEIIFGDFSVLEHLERKFDLITIVGMIEHLTPSRRRQLFDIVKRLLRKDGLVYLQCIAKPRIWIGGDAYRVTQHRVFPGHFLETPVQTENRLRRAGFKILEQFDHCRDYGLTTARWVEKLQENEATLIELVGERQYRMYVGYLAFASRMFSTGRGSLMRYVLKPA